MEDMQAAFKLCGSLGWLSPTDFCSFQVTCKELLHTGVTWHNWNQVIALDLSDPSCCTWLSKNITTIKQLQVTAAAADDAPILSSGALLSSLNIDSTAAGALGLTETSFLQGLQQLVTLRIDAPLLTGLCCLPGSLVMLDISNCPVEILPTLLPQGLKTLACGYCQKLQKLPALPEGLQELKVGFAKSLTELPQLPQGLTYLDMNRCHELKVAPEFPNGLQYLDMDCCSRLESEGALPELPSSLTYLNISGYFGWHEPPEALPPKLKTLKMHFWDGLERLPELPQSIQKLSCSHCDLKTLEGLPDGLTYLHIEYNSHLLQLPEVLPPKLEVLRITGCERLVVLPDSLPSTLKVLKANLVPMQRLPDLPASLEILDMSPCKQLLMLPKFATATSLQELEISGSPALDTLAVEPPGLATLQHLTRLTMSDLTNLTQVDGLPPGLKQLCIRECRQLVSLPDLPLGLNYLQIRDCPQLTYSLPALPATLQTFHLTSMPISLLPSLPAGLIEIDVSANGNLLALPEVLPAGLTRLSCRDDTYFSVLPPLPAGLANLSCEECISLTHLPDLPAKLSELRCSDCSQLEGLPELPTSLRHLECSNCCEVLTTLPVVPPGLTSLNCSNCSRLQRLPDISNTCMRELQCDGCPELLIPLEQLRTLPPTIHTLDLRGLNKVWTNY